MGESNEPGEVARFERSGGGEDFECIVWKDGTCTFWLAGNSSQCHSWELDAGEIKELIALLQKALEGR